MPSISATFLTGMHLNFYGTVTESVLSMATLSRSTRWVPAVWGRYVVYYRDAEGIRGVLTLGAQRELATRFLANGKSKLIKEFTETEVVGDCGRPQLAAAIAFCHNGSAKILIAQIGRLNRDIGFLNALQDSRVKFMAVDLPEANHLHAQALINDEHVRRERFGTLVREGLARAKSRGVKLGGDRGYTGALQLGPAASVTSRRLASRARARRVMTAIIVLRKNGLSTLREFAAGLNELGIRAPRGGLWSAAQVRASMIAAEGDEIS